MDTKDSLDRPKPLFKVASEFNVSIQSIVDTLTSKGFTVANRPNFKVTSEMYQILEKELYANSSNGEKLFEKKFGRAKILIEQNATQKPSDIVFFPVNLNSESVELDISARRLLHRELETIFLDQKEIFELRKNRFYSKIYYDTPIFFIDLIDFYNIKTNPYETVIEQIKNISVKNPHFFIPSSDDTYSNSELDFLNLVIFFIRQISTSIDYDIQVTLSIPEKTVEDKNHILDAFNRLTNKQIRQLPDKIDFHLDNPALEDKLGRRPIAKSLAKLINDDIFGNKKCYSFMAHLQGRWGEGKSSFMKFLENGLQDTGNDRWIVIHYNAWKNQTVDPPWWTFLDALYKQSKIQISKKRPFYSKLTLIFNELINRFNKPSLHLIIFILVLLFLILISIPFQTQIEQTFGFLKPILGDSKITILALLGGGSLITIIQSWSKFLLLNNAENARLFVEKTENPAESIKAHFENLIKSIQKRSGSKKTPFRIAFFIDDLDRCNSDYVVKLLEGIQTMFNEQKVFYLIAADKHWIAKSFESEYAKYSDTVKKGTKLGYSFIEKNFQLSIRLPNPSPKQVSQYWDFILNSKENDSSNTKSSKESLASFQSELNNSDQTDILSGEKNLTELAEKHQITLEEAQSVILEKVNESTKDIEHLLREYHELIGNNPRAVKRLANQYTIYRNLILIEQNKVNPLKLFRWVVLQNRWPILIDEIESNPSIISAIDEAFLEKLNLESHSKAIIFVIGEDGNRLNEEDVRIFTGLNNFKNKDSNHA